MVCLCGISHIGWWIAIRPIIFFAPEIGTGMPVDVRRNVERLAVGERTGRIERHVAADELGGGADARHARPEIVGLRPPNRRRDGGALPRHAVALGADRATWTPSQFVRMPGGTRDNGRAQTIYFFNPGVVK